MPFLVSSLTIILKYSDYKIKLFCKHKTEKRPTNRVDNMICYSYPANSGIMSKNSTHSEMPIKTL